MTETLCLCILGKVGPATGVSLWRTNDKLKMEGMGTHHPLDWQHSSNDFLSMHEIGTESALQPLEECAEGCRQSRRWTKGRGCCELHSSYQFQRITFIATSMSSACIGLHTWLVATRQTSIKNNMVAP